MSSLPPGATTSTALVERTYERLQDRVAQGRRRLRRPLTLTEKIVLGHLDDVSSSGLARGEDDIALRPDRLAMPDSSAQTAILQFMTTGLQELAVPTTVHCDHLVRAQFGAERDLALARTELGEVYDFLASACARFGAGFWEPGTGIIHQVVLENYAFPGGLLVGTDSHTQNGGGLGMLACGVGGAEAVDVMAGLPWAVRSPRLIGVHLTGALRGWATAKDVILALTGILTVKGGTGAVIEYFGPGAETLSATSKATICNMGTETGATSSVFPYDSAMEEYLHSTDRSAVARLATGLATDLRADADIWSEPARFFDRVVELDLNELEPQITGPARPDRVRPISEIGSSAETEGYSTEITNALIGSCTNSSYEDISRAAEVARQARTAGLRSQVPLLISVGSQRAFATLERDGQLDDLKAIGATVLANACGPCIGQWRRTDPSAGQRNSIISSFNRNFPKRNDGSAQTDSFLASPTTVVLAALAGRLDFDPQVDDLPGGARLTPPEVDVLPSRGWEGGAEGFTSPPADRGQVDVTIGPASETLQRLERFSPRSQDDFTGMPVLIKIDGPCTTDHISPAGLWLRMRGHLQNLSENLFLGATNSYLGVTGEGIDQLDGEQRLLPIVARHYRDSGLGWIAIGDDNYGEGSSREHAAMTPRFMGASVVLARTFARIHEANLKKQAVLPLTFVEPNDRALIESSDRIDVIDFDRLAPRAEVTLRIHHANGETAEIATQHTLNEVQITWLRAGSALNTLAPPPS